MCGLTGWEGKGCCCCCLLLLVLVHCGTVLQPLALFTPLPALRCAALPLSLRITPPSVEELQARLSARAALSSEDTAAVQKRLALAAAGQ